MKTDQMTPIPFETLLQRTLHEYASHGTIQGVRQIYAATSDRRIPFCGRWMEQPMGPAAGPHTQLAQNILAAYAGGARYFECKTVQILDGENISVSKPCILAQDECYNVEWSTELTVPQAMEEYIKAWWLLQLLSQEFALGNPEGFIFNMSVGYDYEGICSEKIDAFLNGMQNAAQTTIWQECKEAALRTEFSRVTHTDILAVSPKVCDCVTLSTLHGCPPQEIERIAAYFIEQKHLHTFVKCNPTLVGYKFARQALDELGYDYVAFDDHHFKNDLQLADALPMLARLKATASRHNLVFGVKLTNTFPVSITRAELPGEEMYTSGRMLFPLTMRVAALIAQDFDGPISFSGGADAQNIALIAQMGIFPITLATTLLKPGGYNRLTQIAGILDETPIPSRVFPDVVAYFAADACNNALYRKPVKWQPVPNLGSPLPLLDCFAAPCMDGCPIRQDVPAYLALADEGKYADALRVILRKNPLPTVTGTICNHRCMSTCTRNHYEEAVQIRAVKLLCAQQGMDEVRADLFPSAPNGLLASIVGGGMAGIAAAHLLARSGYTVTVYEQQPQPGGVVRYVVPEFRIAPEAIDADVALAEALGVRFVCGKPAPPLEELRQAGVVLLAIGASCSNPFTEFSCVDAYAFLTDLRAGGTPDLGTDVVVIGGGNTAMDAARAAKRVAGVQNVRIVYRRDMRNMPADEEELLLAQSEGIEFCPLLAPQSWENNALQCTRMQLSAPDASGRRSPVPTQESSTIPATAVIAAIGEHPDASYFTRNGLQTDERGFAVLDDHLQSSIHGVYVIGDASRGTATVVRAIADATTVAAYLTQMQVQDAPPIEDCFAAEKKGVLCPVSAAQSEGGRCLSCNTLCISCVDVCPNRANLALQCESGVQIVHLDDLCNACGNCATFCPHEGAPYKNKLTLFSTPQAYEASSNDGFLLTDSPRVRLFGKEVEEIPLEYKSVIEALIQELLL